jgi:hypothetical protein
MAKIKRPFFAQVGRTEAGSFRITVRAKNPNDSSSGYRQLAVCVYKLAAEMEHRAEAMGAHWVVSAQVFNSRLDLELTERDDEKVAGRFVAKVLADMGLTNR